MKQPSTIRIPFIPLLCIIVLGLTWLCLLACTTPASNQHTPSTGSLSSTTRSSTPNLSAILISFEPDPVKKMTWNDIQLELKDASGKPVADAVIRLQLVPPQPAHIKLFPFDHYHKTEAELQSAKPDTYNIPPEYWNPPLLTSWDEIMAGRYRTTYIFKRPGDWMCYVTAASTKVTLSKCIKIKVQR
jgi:hypothetical protein